MERPPHRAGRLNCAPGATASSAHSWLGLESDRAGRVAVEPDLSVPGHPEIFVLGDTARSEGPDGRLLPAVAPVAKQQGALMSQG